MYWFSVAEFCNVDVAEFRNVGDAEFRNVAEFDYVVEFWDFPN